MNLCRAAFVLTAAGALSACAGGPKVPDWSINAVGHVERFTEAHLKGDARVAAREFELARAETARTGQPVLVARVEPDARAGAPVQRVQTVHAQKQRRRS